MYLAITKIDEFLGLVGIIYLLNVLYLCFVTFIVAVVAVAIADCPLYELSIHNGHEHECRVHILFIHIFCVDKCVRWCHSIALYATIIIL